MGLYTGPTTVFVSFVLKSKGKWKQTGKSNKSVKHIFEETKGSYKLNWWPSSDTINLQGKAETTEKINDTINKIVNDNNKADQKGDDKQDTVNIAGESRDESFATQSSENSNSGDHEIAHSKPEPESKRKRNNFQKEIKEDIKSLWVTVSQ